MRKIKVKPEGREGVWLAEKESVVDFLLDYEFDKIHNMIPTGSMMLGADWSKESVIEEVERSERVAIMTGEASKHNLNHSLSVISKNELYIFDIGEITESNLVVGL